MKKHAAFIALAALAALPACSNDYNNRHYDYNEAQDNRGDHKEWEEAKLDAMVDHFFEKADTNHDGYVSWKEFEAFMRHKFREADTNHDGMLSRDEVKEMLKRHMHKIHEEMRENRESMRHDDGGMRSENMNNDDRANSYQNAENAGDTENPPRYNPQE